MSLPAPFTAVEKLRAALHAKAKGSPGYRFFSLYDKVYRADVLADAYARCQSNEGAPGVDGQTFADIETYGVDRWLGELARDLKGKAYRPQAVRRVWIPKGDGASRPLGIPTVRDRVVQMAAVRVLEPIFEADLPPEQYAYRAGRSAHDALRAVHGLLDRGCTEVVDADLSGYFDSIPHRELMKCVARRVSDSSLLHLLKVWLDCAVEETDGEGRKSRTTRNGDEGRGTPQGSPISPLLANLYMRRFVLGWTQSGHAVRLGARIVNYADDFVICCRPGRAVEAMAVMRRMMGKLKLTVNETKTKTCRVPDDPFTFLGYTFGRQYSAKTGKAYVAGAPSAKKVRSVCAQIGQATGRSTLGRDEGEQVATLNRIILGWGNYFRLGPVSAAWRSVQNHACRRLRQWLQRKHRGRGGTVGQFPSMHLYEEYGLVDLERRVRRLSPWAKA